MRVVVRQANTTGTMIELTAYERGNKIILRVCRPKKWAWFSHHTPPQKHPANNLGG